MNNNHPEMQTIEVKIHPSEAGGFWAEAPEISGCYATGATEDETRDNMKRALLDRLGIDPAQESQLDLAITREASASPPPEGEPRSSGEIGRF